MKTFCTCVFLAGASILGWSALSLAEEPVSFTLSTKELGFPAIDTAVTFTRLAEHTYRVQYTTPPPTPNHLMLYTGFFFCAARQFALDTGFDRTALLPDPEAPSLSGGIVIFLKPGEEAAKVLAPRFANARFSSIELFAPNCPTKSSLAK